MLSLNSLVLCKVPILFSIVKLKLVHNFSQFIHRFKIGSFWELVSGCTSKFFPVHKEIFGFLDATLASAGNTVSKQKWGKKLEWSSWGVRLWLSPDLNCIWKRRNLFTKTSIYLDSSQYSIFFQSLMNAMFFLLGKSLFSWWNCLKIKLYSLFGQHGFCLIFILNKNKCFLSGALLKIFPSSPSM